ncbi:MAG: hypothetical protein ABJA74_02745 [Lapillicoccus sp.]
MGLDLDEDGHRTSIVPEGIDHVPLDRAARAVSGASRGEPSSALTLAALDALDGVLATLPPARRGLPLALTVGRLHRVKGMATLSRPGPPIRR